MQIQTNGWNFLIILAMATSSATAAHAQLPTGEPDWVCYMQTSDGRIINLTSSCNDGQIEQPNVVTPVRQTIPQSTRQTIPQEVPQIVPQLSPQTTLSPEANSIRENIGRDSDSLLCFGLDAQGRPCP